MIEAALLLALLLPLLWAAWRRARSPTRLAAAVLRRAVDAWEPVTLQERGGVHTHLPPPGHELHGATPHAHKRAVDELKRDLLRVRRFAKELENLPVRDGGAIERRGQVRLADTTGNFDRHPSGSALESHGILPRLMKREDDEAPYSVPSVRDMYLSQRNRRAATGAVALRQQAKSGAVTPAHIDEYGVRIRHPVGTHIVTYQGSQLVIAWVDAEAPHYQVLQDMIDPHPSLSLLHHIPSLTVMQLGVGDHVYMQPRIAHIVVTIADKEHLAFHEF